MWPQGSGAAGHRPATQPTCQLLPASCWQLTAAKHARRKLLRPGPLVPPGGLYLADLLLSLHIGFVLVSWDGRRAMVTDGPASLACYARHGYLKWDLPAGGLPGSMQGWVVPCAQSARLDSPAQPWLQ